MAFGAIELTTVSRAQDYSSIKQNEDNKAFVDQSNGQFQVQKNEQRLTKEVHSGDDARWSGKQPDAREKGNGEYYGDGGKRRKQQPREQVVVKGQKSFDIKI
ncbi:MAG: hypothetical protein NC517_08245 [Firmicutes bacterium]|nr:hypothetical protein [Bacillota bacterium]